MIQKLSVNRYIGKVQFHRELKNSNDQIKIQSNNDCFLLYLWDRIPNYIPKSQTINQNYYFEIFSRLRGKIKNKTQIVERIGMDPPYSTDLAPCDYYLFLPLS